MFSSNGRASSRLVDGRGTDAGSGGRVPHRRSWRGVSMRLRLLAGLGLAVAFLATLATLAALPAPPLQAQTTTEVEVPHNWSLKPDGLGGGDQFRLLFLSSEDTDATSTDIADYNTFIQDLAAAGHTDIQAYSAGFRVVGCTADVDARDNTGTNTNTDGDGVPIYWLNGNKVADHNTDFYDGDWDDEANDKNESGADGPDTSNSSNHPYTGCGHNGTEAFFGVSSRALGVSEVRVGGPNTSGTNDGPLSSIQTTISGDSRPMYGLSQVFEVGPPEVLVSNTHLSPSVASSTAGNAQSFETGPNPAGYTVSEVDVWLKNVSGRRTNVSIRENNASDEPGDLVATLANPTSLTADSLNTFTAQDAITLDASTPYWITVNEGISLADDRAELRLTDLSVEVGETGWSIGDGRLFDSSDTWHPNPDSLLIAIKGTSVGADIFTNAYLSGLALEVEDGGEAIA